MSDRVTRRGFITAAAVSTVSLAGCSGLGITKYQLSYGESDYIDSVKISVHDGPFTNEFIAEVALLDLTEYPDMIGVKNPNGDTSDSRKIKPPKDSYSLSFSPQTGTHQVLVIDYDEVVGRLPVEVDQK